MVSPTTGSKPETTPLLSAVSTLSSDDASKKKKQTNGSESEKETYMNLLGDKDGSFGDESAQDSTENIFFQDGDPFSVRGLFNTTESVRMKALQQKGVGDSAFLIRDAVVGSEDNPAEGAYSPYDDHKKKIINWISIVCRRLVTISLFRQFIVLNSWVLVLITFIEPPDWCRYYVREGEDDIDVVEFTSRDGRCGELMNLWGPSADGLSNHTQYYPNTSTTFENNSYTHIIEAVCLFVCWVFILLKIGRDGSSLRIYFRPSTALPVRLLEAMSVVMLTIGLLMDVITPSDRNRVLAPFFRLIIMIAESPGCQKEIIALWHMIPEARNVLILLFLIIAFFGWIGVVAFYGSEEGLRHFPNIVDGMWTLWIMVTTANYPDVMMPSYNINRLSTLYFILFMTITFFFFMNVILASVVNAYENDLDKRRTDREETQIGNLSKAFDLMDHDCDGRIGRETVMALFVILNEDFPEFRKIPPDDARILFALLDKDGSHRIDKEEFLQFGNILLLQFEKVVYHKSVLERCCPGIYHSSSYKAFERFVNSKWFDYIIDAILVLNAVVVLIQSYPMLAGESIEKNPHLADGEIDTVWEEAETVFTAIYTLEMVIKLSVFGWHKFTESSRNMFDLTITVLAVLSTAYVYYPNNFYDSRLIRYIVMARVLRLARLVAAVEMFNLIATISIDVLGRASNVLTLLFCVLYCFASLGVGIFGGMISRDPSDPRAFRVLDTDFSDNDYWANNFNDMFGALNVLFNLLVINNWTECADGFEAVAETRATRLYFLGFHVIGVILVNNLVTAFIINAFIKQWDFRQERLQRRVLVDGEATIEGREATFEADTITGTVTELHGTYVAKVRQQQNTLYDLQHQQVLLKDIFSKSGSGSLRSTSDVNNDGSS